jgi:hypothetical protein
MSKIDIISKHIDEVPHFFEFTKNDFVADCPGMENLDYDPFPDKKPEDVARREIIAQKLVLHATLKGDVMDIRPGVDITIDGHDFAVTSAKTNIDIKDDQDSTAEVEGQAFLTPSEPLKVLAQLRKALAADSCNRSIQPNIKAPAETSTYIAPDLKPSLCAFLDILGFSAVIEEAYTQGKQAHLLAEMTGVLDRAAERVRSAVERLAMLSVKFFTDNVVIGYSYLTKGAIPELMHLCELLADYQFEMACAGHFVRGGVSIGTLAVNRDLVFGDSLLKAHRLEDQLAQSPRIILDPVLKDTILQCFSSCNGPWRSTWSIRVMLDVDGYLFVNYLAAAYEPGPISQGRVMYPNENKLHIHRSQLESKLNDSRSKPTVWSKYFWAANYHNTFCEGLGFKRCRIDDALLRPQPLHLS